MPMLFMCWRELYPKDRIEQKDWWDWQVPPSFTAFLSKEQPVTWNGCSTQVAPWQPFSPPKTQQTAAALQQAMPSTGKCPQQHIPTVLFPAASQWAGTTLPGLNAGFLLFRGNKDRLALLEVVWFFRDHTWFFPLLSEHPHGLLCPAAERKHSLFLPSLQAPRLIPTSPSPTAAYILADWKYKEERKTQCKKKENW